MAAPFVQGQLRQGPLTIQIKTSCAHCGQPILVEVNQELNYKVNTPGAGPLIFEPHLDWDTFAEPNIIHAY